MKKKFLAVAICLMLVITLLPVSAFAASSASYTKVTGSQYKKLTQGSISKKQVEWVIESLICHGGRGSTPLYLSAKKINKMGKSQNMVRRIAMFGAKSYEGDTSRFLSEKETDQWCEAHPLKQSNRILSFFTSYRYAKNKKQRQNGYLICRTTGKKLFYYGGIGYESCSKIVSAKKNSKKMILTVERSSIFYGDGNTPIAKYKVVLKKQKNGRYKLYSIKETWIDPGYANW